MGPVKAPLLSSSIVKIKKLKVMSKRKLLKKGFDYESKLEELIFEMCVDNEDEECLMYAVEVLKKKLNSIFDEDDE